jgi:hypothetical protein
VGRRLEQLRNYLFDSDQRLLCANIRTFASDKPGYGHVKLPRVELLKRTFLPAALPLIAAD